MGEAGLVDHQPEDWRYSHIIRFSHIDGAGIVYYPRYFEMLADSFPQQFAMLHPAQLELTFRHPVRLGERLYLQQKAPGASGDFRLEGQSGGNLCFELRMTALAQTADEAAEETADQSWLNHSNAFVRQVQIGDWMCGADSRLHLGRCYELTAVLMEEWFTHALDCPFATLESTDGALVPTVRLQTAVHELPKSGDWVTASLSVLHIGHSSLGLGMSIQRDDRLLVQTRQTIVFVRHENGQLGSVDIPHHLLELLQPQSV
jgi:acyl-CoA thioesterase FadM